MSPRTCASGAAAAPRVPANLQLIEIETVDSWIRDYGPNFLLGPEGQLAFNHWGFNAWGGKYESLMRDASVPARLDVLAGVTKFEPGLVLEGGSIDVNGAGHRAHDRAVPAASQPQSGRVEGGPRGGAARCTSASSRCCGSATASRATTPTATSTTSRGSWRRTRS